MSETETDTLALVGLRRMVIHSRDMLKRNLSDYDKKSYASGILAIQVLTLVADCIPAGDSLTADEANEQMQALRREAAEARAAAQAAQAEVEKAKAVVQDVRLDRDQYRDSYVTLDSLIQERFPVTDLDDFDAYAAAMDTVLTAAKSTQTEDSPDMPEDP